MNLKDCRNHDGGFQCHLMVGRRGWEQPGSTREASEMTVLWQAMVYDEGFGKLCSGQDIVEDFQKWREGGLIDKLKAAVEEVEKEGKWHLQLPCPREALVL